MHPFVNAMNKTLQARSDSSQPLNMISNLVFGPSQKLDADRLFMRETAMQLVQQRRNHPAEKKDLLNAMLHGKDPKSGELMRDDLIVANMTTFLIAGESSTSSYWVFRSSWKIVFTMLLNFLSF
jgi:cytochrome P450 / NADPH-cytochrome P450 reductase